ncbi:MAG: metallophosphoesterase family protein, partial [Deltaproteobacteria bacterium]|nr:metallophosphoesterase family protein [Deltaproteobacteria bacterium]
MKRKPPLAFLAALVVGPYLQDLRPDGVLVSFETDAPSAAAVEVGPDTSFGQVVPSATSGTHHDVRLSGLAAGTAWHYRVLVDGQPAGEPGTFVTSPEPGSTGAFTFLVAGDNRSDANAHALVVSRMTEHEADFVVNTGDMVSSGEVASQWVEFFAIEAALVRDTPIYPTVGNHDEDDGDLPEPYLRLFTPPPGSGHDSYYSFDHGNSRFIVLDGYVEVDDEWSCLLKILNWGKCFDEHQSEWLEATLKDATGDPAVDHVFVFTHEGPYSSKPGRSGSPQMRRLLDLFSVNKVRVVISGHDHYYEHGLANNGLPYVITGGGGAPLYETSPGLDLLHPHQVLVSTSVHNFLRVFVQGPYIEVTAYDATGTQIDRFEIGGKPECSNAADCNDGEPGVCAGKWSCGADSRCAWVCDPPPPCLTVLDCGAPPAGACPGHWQCLGSCAWTCDSSGECWSDLECASHPPLNECPGGFFACVDDVCEWKT